MPGETSRTRILVVEDEESVRQAIEAGLEVIGEYDIHSAPDAESGFALLAETRPDILLLDLVMPVIDGMEFLQRLRQDLSEFRPGKVVLMTAHANPVPAGNMGDLGLDSILSKPFRLNELAAAVGAKSPFED
jgi:CheY-like chemotaxis protein